MEPLATRSLNISSTILPIRIGLFQLAKWPEYGLRDRRIGVWFRTGAENFLSFTPSTPALGSTQPVYSTDTEGNLRGVHRREYESDNSPPSSSQGYEWQSYTSKPSYI